MFLYYALFDFDSDGITISFPDLEGAYSAGADMQEALFMSQDLLEGWLILAEEAGETLPLASTLEVIQERFPNRFIVPISINLKFAREKHFGKPVKKTLTIPSYINRLAIENGINFSHVLTELLKEKIQVL